MKTAVITGAAGGMGSAAAKRLISEGWTVYGLDLRGPDDIPGLRFLRTDLCDPASVARAADAVRKDGEKIGCIIHMAGIYDLNSLAEMPEEDWRRIFEVNLTAVYRVNREFLPLLGENARIVITSSELAPSEETSR